VARFSKPADDFGVWKKMPEMKAEKNWSGTSGKFKFYNGYMSEVAGDSIGAWFSWDTTEGENIKVKVGVSYVSIENARMNLDTEQADFDFERVHNHAKKVWNDRLSKIMVEGGSDNDKTIFFTSLYHMNIHPNILNDVNGDYPAMGGYHTLNCGDENRYTIFSLWDTYRNLHPFFSLVYPEIQIEMVHSMLDMYREHGWLPKWEFLSNEANIMEGDPSIPVIVDTYFRGLKDFDIEFAYEAMRKGAVTPGNENLLRPDNDDYLKLGYVPLREKYDNSVSHALEYYVADWNLAQMAKELGKTEDYKRFLAQSMGYKNYWDDEYDIIRPKLPDGNFLTPFSPRQGENFEPSPGFHEGNAWQYTFYVPHDIPGLIKLMGGKKKFVNKLQSVFDEGHYDVANEPDINYPYLFNYIKGEEWRTQKEVRRLIKEHYHNNPGGIPGNDDCGTLSAWVVFSMMGFYPVCPGNMDYAISSPVFDKVTIELNMDYYPNKKIVIESNKKSDDDIYIDKMYIEGKPWKRYFITHDELVNSRKISFILGDKPEK
jgi:predicted alpha-1,2-mannosidase